MDNNLYLVTFEKDLDSANFYEEVSLGTLKPLFESKMIDSSKIMERCSSASFKIDCETILIINGKPQKVFIKKYFPSNLDGRSQFFNLLEEHTSNGGSKIKG